MDNLIIIHLDATVSTIQIREQTLKTIYKIISEKCWYSELGVPQREASQLAERNLLRWSIRDGGAVG